MEAARYKCELSSEVLADAIADINEPGDDEARLAEIDKLKASFSEKYPALNLLRNDDVFLLRFLRSCDFDQNYALKTLGYYHKLRKEWREVFELVENKSSVEHVLKEGAVVSLEGRAKNGSFILVKRPGLGLGSGDSIATFIASVVLSYEKLLENEEAQIYGFTVIADLGHLGWRFGMQMASIGRRFIKMLQEALPIQVKSLNVVNEAFVFDAIYKVASQFMNNDMKRKIKFHKRNLTGLQDMIDANVLPPFLGGSGPEVDTESWAKQVVGEQNGSQI